MTRDETIAELQRLLANATGVRLAILFGSVARGQEHVGSDVDLAVLADDAVDTAELSARLSRALGREVEIVDLRDPGVPLLEELLRDGVVVHEGVAYAAATWRARVLCDLEIDRPWYTRMRDAWLQRVAERGLLDGQS